MKGHEIGRKFFIRYARVDSAGQDAARLRRCEPLQRLIFSRRERHRDARSNERERERERTPRPRARSSRERHQSSPLERLQPCGLLCAPSLARALCDFTTLLCARRSQIPGVSGCLTKMLACLLLRLATLSAHSTTRAIQDLPREVCESVYVDGCTRLSRVYVSNVSWKEPT